MRLRNKSYLLLGLLVCCLLVGCGNTFTEGIVGSNFASKDMAMSNSMTVEDSAMYYDEYRDYTEADIVKNTMMVVRNADMSVDVANLEEFTDSVTTIVESFDGYFEQVNVNNYDSEWATHRYANYTIRIPAEHLDEFINDVDGTAKITSKNVTSEDVSLEYVDVNAHISALETEQKELNRLLSMTTEVEDMITIEQRLSEVQANLDSYNGQKRLLEGRVSYSTVWLSASEERDVEHPIRQALHVNLKNVFMEGIERTVDVFMGCIVAIPIVIILSVFVLLFIWLWRKVWRKVFKKDSQNIKYMFVPVAMETESKVANAPISTEDDEPLDNK